MNDTRILIHYDPQGLEETEDPNTTMIHDISDYVKGYKLIIDCLKSKKAIKIVVKNPTVFAWLQKLTAKYGEATLEFKEVMPSTLLAEKWGFSIPNDVTEEEIIELNLLNLQVQRETGLTFTDFILSKFISPMMRSETTPLEDLPKITVSICKDEVQANLRRNLVQREFERKIESWLRRAKSEQEREVIELLWQNPKGLEKALSIYAVLENYPKEVGERASGNIFNSIKKLGLNPASIAIDSTEIDAAVNNIEIFLNSEFKDGISESDAIRIIEWASGSVPAEFKLIAQILERFPNALTKTVLISLLKKFSLVQTAIQPEFRKLNLLLKPDLPPAPEMSWDAPRMLQWVTNQYLPYHFWLEETDNDDAEVSHQSEIYGDWLYANFVNLRSNFSNIVYRILPNIMNMRTSDKCVLVLVIDNFNYRFVDALTSLLQVEGFRLIQKIPYFSMIPSDTEVSKRCLLSGQPKASEVLSDYDSLLSNEWPRYFPDRRFMYLRSPLELETLAASFKDVVFVNCIQTDNILHEDERRLGKRHSVAVEDDLRSIVHLATGFFNRNMLANNAQIIVCSDHGSTVIPSGVHNEIESAFFAEKTLQTHHRFISISKEEFEKLPENIKFQCYFLDATSFGLFENVLIARGYYRFKRTDEHFFVHGGLSPEETVVPLLIFEGGTVAFKEPGLRLLQNEFRRLTKAIVEIEIVNENSAPLEDVKITIVSPGVETVEPIPIIQKVAPTDLQRIKFYCRLYNDFDATKGLEMIFEYTFLGKPYSKKEKFDVQIKSMMETSFKRDELI